MALEVLRNEHQSRYELVVDDIVVGIADYRDQGDTVVFPHTEIEPQMRGRGLGDILIRGALDDVRRRNATAKVRPDCWFVREFLRDNPDYADLKAS